HLRANAGRVVDASASEARERRLDGRERVTGREQVGDLLLGQVHGPGGPGMAASMLFGHRSAGEQDELEARAPATLLVHEVARVRPRVRLCDREAKPASLRSLG